MPPRRRRSAATREEQEEEIQNAVMQVPQLTPAERAERIPSNFRLNDHFAPAWVDIDVLRRSGIYDEVRRMLRRSGWPGLLTLSGDADVEDTCMFLGTFSYESSGDRSFSYTYRGREYICSLADIRRVFGWSPNPQFHYISVLDERRAWRELADNPCFTPSSSTSLSRNFREPVMFYLQFVLSRTLFARKNGNEKVTKAELTILDLMRQGGVVDWAWFFCAHLKRMRVVAPVTIGGMVTYFLRSRHPSPEDETRRILRGDYMHQGRFESGNSIVELVDGTLEWAYHLSPAERARLAARPRGRPRGSGPRQRERAAREAEAAAAQRAAEAVAQVPPPPSAQRQRQWEAGEGSSSDPTGRWEREWTQARIDAAFNAVRAQNAGYPLIDLVSAPPGWRPGDAIPPEYQ